MRALDEEIARAIRESERSGEMKQARGYGKPLESGAGYDETPGEFRMAFKILKDAGILPPEIETLRQAARLREQLKLVAPEGEGAARLRQKLVEIELKIAVRLESMRASGRL